MVFDNNNISQFDVSNCLLLDEPIIKYDIDETICEIYYNKIIEQISIINSVDVKEYMATFLYENILNNLTENMRKEDEIFDRYISWILLIYFSCTNMNNEFEILINKTNEIDLIEILKYKNVKNNNLYIYIINSTEEIFGLFLSKISTYENKIILEIIETNNMYVNTIDKHDQYFNIMNCYLLKQILFDYKIEINKLSKYNIYKINNIIDKLNLSGYINVIDIMIIYNYYNQNKRTIDDYVLENILNNNNPSIVLINNDNTYKLILYNEMLNDINNFIDVKKLINYIENNLEIIIKHIDMAPIYDYLIEIDNIDGILYKHLLFDLNNKNIMADKTLIIHMSDEFITKNITTIINNNKYNTFVGILINNDKIKFDILKIYDIITNYVCNNIDNLQILNIIINKYNKIISFENIINIFESKKIIINKNISDLIIENTIKYNDCVNNNIINILYKYCSNKILNKILQKYYIHMINYDNIINIITKNIDVNIYKLFIGKFINSSNIYDLTYNNIYDLKNLIINNNYLYETLLSVEKSKINYKYKLNIFKTIDIEKDVLDKNVLGASIKLLLLLSNNNIKIHYKWIIKILYNNTNFSEINDIYVLITTKNIDKYEKIYSYIFDNYKNYYILLGKLINNDMFTKKIYDTNYEKVLKDKYFFELILKSKYTTENIINKITKYNTTMLMHAINHLSPIEPILNIINENTFCHLDNDNKSCIDYCFQNDINNKLNRQNLQSLLSNEYMLKCNLFYIKHFVTILNISDTNYFLEIINILLDKNIFKEQYLNIYINNDVNVLLRLAKNKYFKQIILISDKFNCNIFDIYRTNSILEIIFNDMDNFIDTNDNPLYQILESSYINSSHLLKIDTKVLSLPLSYLNKIYHLLTNDNILIKKNLNDNTNIDLYDIFISKDIEKIKLIFNSKNIISKNILNKIDKTYFNYLTDDIFEYLESNGYITIPNLELVILNNIFIKSSDNTKKLYKYIIDTYIKSQHIINIINEIIKISTITVTNKYNILYSDIYKNMDKTYFYDTILLNRIIINNLLFDITYDLDDMETKIFLKNNIIYNKLLSLSKDTIIKLVINNIITDYDKIDDTILDESIKYITNHSAQNNIKLCLTTNSECKFRITEICDNMAIYNLINIDNSIIYNRDIYDNNLLDYLIEKKNREVVKYIITNSINILEIKDITNTNYLCKLIKYYNDYEEIIIELFENNKITLNMLTNIDSKGNNILMYCLNNKKMITMIMNHSLFTIKMIQTMNIIEKTNCLMKSIEMGSSYIFDLLSPNDLLNQNVCFYNKTMGSVLTKACRYYPLMIKKIFDILDTQNKEYLNILMKVKENGCNFLQIATQYNIYSLKILLELKNDIKEYFIEKITYNDMEQNCITIAALYNQNNILPILNYKFCDTDYITKLLIVGNEHFYSIIIRNQPSSLLILKQHNHFKHVNPACIGDYNLTTVLGKINNKIFNRFNEIEDDTNNNICSICYTYKIKILLNSCSHTLCIACSLILSLQNSPCPICRTPFTTEKMIPLYFD